MTGKVGKHLDEESAEKFSTGSLSARRVAEIEEHLLLCDPCRQAVAASDAYVAAIRTAAAKLREAEQRPRHKRSAFGD